MTHFLNIVAILEHKFDVGCGDSFVAETRWDLDGEFADFNELCCKFKMNWSNSLECILNKGDPFAANVCCQLIRYK